MKHPKHMSVVGYKNSRERIDKEHGFGGVEKHTGDKEVPTCTIQVGSVHQYTEADGKLTNMSSDDASVFNGVTISVELGGCHIDMVMSSEEFTHMLLARSTAQVKRVKIRHINKMLKVSSNERFLLSMDDTDSIVKYIAEKCDELMKTMNVDKSVRRWDFERNHGDKFATEWLTEWMKKNKPEFDMSVWYVNNNGFGSQRQNGWGFSIQRYDFTEPVKVVY